MEQQLQCPKCNSTQLTANKKGFSGKKAVAGAFLTGGIGLLAGTIGSNKVMITCLSCGYEHIAGSTSKEKNKFDERKRASHGAEPVSELGATIFIGFLTTLSIFFTYLLFSNGWKFIGSILSIISILGILFTGILIYDLIKENKKIKVSKNKPLDPPVIWDDDLKTYVRNPNFKK